MRWIGGLARSILNINTIWGLMILVAFGLCAVQHYVPTTSVLPLDRVREGQNELVIQIVGPKEQTTAYTYSFSFCSGGTLLSKEDQGPRGDRPWLISAHGGNGCVLLTWDTNTYGRYTISCNGVAAASGRLVTLQSLTDAAFDYAQKGFEVALGLVAAMVLLLGLMKVGEDAGIVQLVARVFHPLIRFLFPDVPRDHPAAGAILMNWTTTLLGLGNAATPFGLKAMQELQSLNRNPRVATDSQIMLLGYNTAGLALLPTTLLAVRKSAGCSDPFEIIGTCLIAGAVATVTAIVMVKLLGKLPMFALRSAVAEDEQEQKRATAGGSGEGR